MYLGSILIQESQEEIQKLKAEYEKVEGKGDEDAIKFSISEGRNGSKLIKESKMKESSENLYIYPAALHRPLRTRTRLNEPTAAKIDVISFSI